ncbi:SDR family NAD(P)-dependent oxidoreductase [Peribacillus simplex]|nr:SDR family NAD(P)-dependent oxidoreductase [Peribacillus simplex]MCM3677137.1 SDR family NAD(P)-dependent oxidoreductase [Peribacillus simplex]
MTNRTILVKGGTSGIGSAIAKKFLEMGNTVIVTSRSKQNIDQAIKENPNFNRYCCGCQSSEVG